MKRRTSYTLLNGSIYLSGHEIVNNWTTNTEIMDSAGVHSLREGDFALLRGSSAVGTHEWTGNNYQLIGLLASSQNKLKCCEML